LFPVKLHQELMGTIMAIRRVALVLAALLASAGVSLHAQEMVGQYKLVSALPRPGATEILDNDRGRVLAGGQVVFLRGGHVRTIEATDGNVRAAMVELK